MTVTDARLISRPHIAAATVGGREDTFTADVSAADRAILGLLTSAGAHAERPRARHAATTTAEGNAVITAETPWERLVRWALDLPAMPTHMFDHHLLDVDQERLLGERIRAGIQASTLTGADVSRTSQRQVRDGQLAMEILIRANLRLARSVATAVFSNLPEQDRVGFGILGLMRAATTFDPDRGRFSTYATWWIRQSTHRGSDDTERLIRVPVHALDVLRSARRTRQEMAAELGRAPTLGELSSHCGIDSGKLAWLLLISQHPLSLDDWVSTDTTDRAGRSTDWWALLESSDVDASDPFEAADDRLCARSVRTALRAFEADVESGVVVCAKVGRIRRAMAMLYLRMGMVDGEEWTLDRIGEQDGVTRERVRQILAHLLDNPELRRRLAAAGDLADPTN